MYASLRASEVRRLEERAHELELERLLGRKTMEVEILKDELDLARAKKPTRSPVPGDIPMKTVAATLGVARSNAQGWRSLQAWAADPCWRCRARRRYPAPGVDARLTYG
jgi:hypothetical protein